MLRRFKYIISRTILYYFSGIHNHYIICHLCNNTQIMSDHHYRSSQLFF